MEIFNYLQQKDEFEGILRRKDDFSVLDVVQDIISRVRNEGDAALLELSNKFDDAGFVELEDMVVSEEEFAVARERVSGELKAALQRSYERICAYHQRQMPQDLVYEDDLGVELGNVWRSIERVGVYAPGGSASYPSSVLMSAAVARVAGVDEVILCAPTSEGRLNDAILVAAEICGIEKVYKIGGAQAIAAMAVGTDLIAKVDKVVGPGNAYVAGAKKLLFGEVGIDMIAGPTDLTIVCDKNCRVEWVAMDALSQLEHGADSQVFVICDCEDFASQVLMQMREMAQKLPRHDIIAKSLENSAFVVVEDLNLAPEIVNRIAPEHLELMQDGAREMVAKIRNAGAIFVGKYTPEAVGDYIAGPSHVLPTNGTARFASGLSVYDFLKRVSLISCGKEGLEELARDVVVLAESEGLLGHALRVKNFSL